MPQEGQERREASMVTYIWRSNSDREEKDVRCNGQPRALGLFEALCPALCPATGSSPARTSNGLGGDLS